MFYGFNVVNDGFGWWSLQKRTLFFFFFKLSWTYPFFIIADTPQLFLHVKGMNYSITEELNINRLNFECLSKRFSEGTVRLTQFQLSRLCNHFISLHNRAEIKRVMDWWLNYFAFILRSSLLDSEVFAVMWSTRNLQSNRPFNLQWR